MSPEEARLMLEADAMRGLLLMWFAAQFWVLPWIGNCMIMGTAKAVGVAWRIARRRSPCAS